MTLSRLTCEETFRKLDHYLDRALSEGDVQLVEQHLETCAQCASEYRFEASFVDEMRSKLLGIAIPEGFRAKLLAKLAEAGR
jgi:anti-sigma factor (TIGR02949 family)